MISTLHDSDLWWKADLSRQVVRKKQGIKRWYTSACFTPKLARTNNHTWKKTVSLVRYRRHRTDCSGERSGAGSESTRAVQDYKSHVRKSQTVSPVELVTNVSVCLCFVFLPLGCRWDLVECAGISISN